MRLAREITRKYGSGHLKHRAKRARVGGGDGDTLARTGGAGLTQDAFESFRIDEVRPMPANNTMLRLRRLPASC